MARWFGKSFRMVMMKQGLRSMRCAGIVAGALALAGCAGGSISPISDSLTGTALGPKAHDPKAFVVATRPADQDYLPVGVTPPQREIKPKSQAEIAAQQAVLAGQAQAAASSGAAITADGARVKAQAPKVPKVE